MENEVKGGEGHLDRVVNEFINYLKTLFNVSVMSQPFSRSFNEIIRD